MTGGGPVVLPDSNERRQTTPRHLRGDSDIVNVTPKNAVCLHAMAHDMAWHSNTGCFAGSCMEAAAGVQEHITRLQSCSQAT